MGGSALWVLQLSEPCQLLCTVNDIGMLVNGRQFWHYESISMGNGYFMLGFLQEGSYKVSVRAPSDKFKEIENVNVLAGAGTDLGTIELE